MHGLLFHSQWQTSSRVGSFCSIFVTAVNKASADSGVRICFSGTRCRVDSFRRRPSSIAHLTVKAAGSSTVSTVVISVDDTIAESAAEVVMASCCSHFQMVQQTTWHELSCLSIMLISTVSAWCRAWAILHGTADGETDEVKLACALTNHLFAAGHEL